MFHRISLDSLVSYYSKLSIDNISSSGHKNACVDNTVYEINDGVEVIKILDKDIEEVFFSPGYYGAYNNDYHNSLQYPEGYFVTGDTISRLNEVTAYDGSLVAGLNFNNEGGFSGILDIHEEYVRYVFNAGLTGNSIVENTGVEYFDFIDSGLSFLKYYPQNEASAMGNIFFHKEDNAFFEIFSPKLNTPPFIDRGGYLSPLYLHEALTEINSLDDLQYSIFNI